MLISVIVPIYNKQNYLSKCIESILSQSYLNLEIILVNDGSTDMSGEICIGYSRRDSRIKYFETKNNGVSEARNIGIKESNGKKILFVDADDYLDRDYVENFIQYPDYFVISGYIQNNKKIMPETQKLTHVDVINSYGSLNLFLNTPICKLYDSTVIKKNNLKFLKKLKYGEDLEFNLRYLSKIHEVFFLSKSGYNIVESPRGLSRVSINNMWEYQSEIANTAYRYYGADERFATGFISINLKIIRTTLYYYIETFSEFKKMCVAVTNTSYFSALKEYIQRDYSIKIKEKIVFLLLDKRMHFMLYLLLKLNHRT
ncbi:glycosyltransferase family 2 protein [Enterococcus faecium]|uniref:glycosyltransferase family 2 protein n=1 Tax=Enterococcus faecium TaxID=1352 RepID=UPI000CF2EE9D|nr:glycosyltransferase family 2 protein [Enterococcus faecium]MDW3728105.1 glycosyltransferase family 2 protein [Enterococcus faecium]PQF12426.1 hypothetical protein CUS96_11680 [Enterococcus faecium]PQH03428.1 hypothetical protein CUS45_13310 [Enterococcus faecium]ROW94679.1 glycosyltransferase family 2 protein [Enterococcus faecium]ROX47442.1 glycosyltransferase family 2 protein [Enterococcus faecium]